MNSSDLFPEQLLAAVEVEFRNQYWIIRSSRQTNWKAVNRTRVLAQMMYLFGIPRWAVKEARYCLRSRVCKRCIDLDLRCHAMSARLNRGDFKLEN
jgi:hypothetical protein